MASDRHVHPVATLMDLARRARTHCQPSIETSELGSVAAVVTLAALAIVALAYAFAVVWVGP